MKTIRKVLIALGILIICFAIYTIAIITHDRCTLEGHKTVICIPVYGQSLALGEEAVRKYHEQMETIEGWYKDWQNQLGGTVEKSNEDAGPLSYHCIGWRKHLLLN